MAFKDQWSDWEVIRRQVALCGRVLAGRALLAGGDVRIEGMKRPKPTAPGEDGIYFFLDLPAGDYTVTFRDATGKRRGKGAGEVSWTAAGDVQRAVVDIAV